jgi:hypothetical protein
MLKRVYTNASREFVKYKLQLSFVFDKSRHHFILNKLVSPSAPVWYRAGTDVGSFER